MDLYLKSAKMHLKSALEYKSSFILSIISQFLILFTSYFIIISLFTKFNNIKGFTMYEVLLTYSIIQFGFSFNETFARGIDTFDSLIIKGGFDLLLLRPRNILLQVLCSKINFQKAAKCLNAIIILVIALMNLNIKYNLLKVITLVLMILSSIVIFFCLFLMMATYCFFTIKNLEIRNLVCSGGRQIAMYPMGIFKKGVLMFFTFIIPYALVNYYPLLYFLGKSNNVFYSFCPLIVFLYIIPTLLFFKIGIKKYTSTGS